MPAVLEGIVLSIVIGYVLTYIIIKALHWYFDLEDRRWWDSGGPARQNQEALDKMQREQPLEDTESHSC